VIQILVKPRAYRHFLYNTRFLLLKRQSPHGKLKDESSAGLGDSPEEQKHPERQAWLTVAKRFIALSLIDAYIRWFYLCAYGKSSFTDPSTRAHESLPRHSLPRLLVALLDVVLRARRTGPPDITYAMGTSYFLVWASTFAETLALYSTVSMFSAIYVKTVRLWRQRSHGKRCEGHTLHRETLTEKMSDQDEGADDALEDASAFLLSASSDAPIQEEPETGTSGLAVEVLEGVDMIDLYRYVFDLRQVDSISTTNDSSIRKSPAQCSSSPDSAIALFPLDVDSALDRPPLGKQAAASLFGQPAT
jgi:hypothetical protein